MSAAGRDGLSRVFGSTEYMTWASRLGNLIDARKLAAEFSGVRKTRCGSKYAQGLQILCRENPPAFDPPPPPPPSPLRYAPRTHNLGGHNQDPRFCCRPEYGVKVVTHPVHGECYEDEMGVHYDLDKMLDLDGGRQRDYMVQGLKGADSMDGLEPCDPYSANGISVPPYPGDPYAQTGSYHR